MMWKNSKFIFLLLILFGIHCCNTTEPPPPPNGDKPTLTLKLEDVSCTEAWLELTTTDLQLPTSIVLEQNDIARDTINLSNADTLLYIDSLLPSTNYKYQASSNEHQVSSNELNVTTLDTTSQNFSFEVLEFGDGFESSYFNDVWVFSENNIWAVGYISPSDTVVNGTPIINPNIIRWNGVKWELELFDGTSSGIDGIWAVNPSLIYFAFGNILKYQNGVYGHIVVPGNWETGQRIEKLWGSSESNIYGVGPWGTIVWYNGVQWTKIEFDTQWYFYEITGNKETGVGYAVAISPSNQYDALVVKLENLTTSIIYQKSLSEIKILSRTITGYNNDLYIAGSDVQNTKICRLSETGEVEILNQISPFIGIKQSIALNKNDLFFAGDEGFEARLIHYNGVRYSIFNIPQVEPNIYGGIHAIKDLAVSVGFTNNKAYIIKIRRQ